MFRKTIYFTINGEIVELGGKEVFAPLSETLRYLLRKTGTKVVCAEGDCGACTLMLARSHEGVFRAINSCIYPTFSVDGCHLVTIEGLAKEKELHEIQQSMIRNFGGQCGFCTPGFVMAIANLYENKKTPTEKNVKNYLTGNLCRCTGYQPIIQAALDVDSKNMKTLGERYKLKDETELLKTKLQQPILIETEELEFYAPTSISDLVEYKSKCPQARIFSGATDLGVQINKGKNPGVKRVSLHLIPNLDKIVEENGRLRIGAKVTLDQLQRHLQKTDPEFAAFLNIFASPQIKNSATLVGNLANGSPIADTTPYLIAAEASLNLAGKKGARTLAVENFFKAYKSFNITEDEFITEISWPLLKNKSAKTGLYKISQRRDLDISCVNACIIFHMNGEIVEKARIVYGGVGPMPLRLPKVEEIFLGQKISPELVSKAKNTIAKSIQPLSDARGTAEFRILMAEQLFQKFIEEHFQI